MGCIINKDTIASKYYVYFVNTDYTSHSLKWTACHSAPSVGDVLQWALIKRFFVMESYWHRYIKIGVNEPKSSHFIFFLDI